MLPLLQVPTAEVEAEYSSAASEFRASGQEFDEQRLREQVVEALKARPCTPFAVLHACLIGMLQCAFGTFHLNAHDLKKAEVCYWPMRLVTLTCDAQQVFR